MARRACRRLVGALALSLAASPVSANDVVETLTAATFDTRIQADFIVVKFYAPWCGHCKAMAPSYEEAAMRLRMASPPIPLAKVDATEEPELAQRQGIPGYPTLKIFRKGVASEYSGPRDADGIVEYVKREAGATGGDAPVASGAASESPLLMAKLCQDQTCNDEKFPIIDFDPNQNKCVCSAHPCWDDGGKAHSCDGDEFPHLSFTYSKDGNLECACSKKPHYMSPYIAKVKCPGEHCEGDEHPVLDFSPEENRCLCRKHPCHDMDGVKHDCSSPEFPILHYREEKAPDGKIRKLCECKSKIAYKKASEEL